MIMHDWRLTDELEPNIDPRPWRLEIKAATEVSFIVVATCPDGTERQVWIEIQDGKLVLLAYDPGHDEPVNLRIGNTDITIDSDRERWPVERYDPEHCDARADFIQNMAGMSLPDEEWKDAGCAGVEEYVAGLDDERLCGEYATFMDMVRAARKLLSDEGGSP